jgi:hypothetical protein
VARAALWQTREQGGELLDLPFVVALLEHRPNRGKM